MPSMNRKLLIEGLERGPAQKSFGDWRFIQFRKNADPERLRIVERDAGKGPPPPAADQSRDSTGG
jgi:hypothetical protein